MPDNQPKKMSQADFLAKIRKEVPELATFKDNDVMDKIFQTRPEIRDMIETPDDVAARNQLQLEQKARTQSSFMKSVLDALPGVGGVLGAAGGEGVASVPLSLLGVAGGKGLAEIIKQGLGIDPTTGLTDKFVQSGKEAGTAYLGGKALNAIPTLANFVSTPTDSLREMTGDALSLEPRFLRRWINPQVLEDFAAGVNKNKEFPRASGFASSDLTPEVAGDVVGKGGIDPKTGKAYTDADILEDIKKALNPSKTSFYAPESNEPVKPDTPKADTKINNAKKVTLHLN